MNGVYSYDGYIYQTVVVLYLVLDAILDPEKGLSCFYLEVNDKNDEFSVDAVIVNTKGDTADFYEVKGGKFSFEECRKKLENSSRYFLKKGLVKKSCKFKTRVIYKNEKQLTKKDIKEHSQFLYQLSNSLHLTATSSKPTFSALELQTMQFCRGLVRNILSNFDSESQKIRIYLAWRHFIEVRIQYLAEKMRNNKGVTPEKITLEEFLKSDNLICDILAEVFYEDFADKSDVYDRLLGSLRRPDYKKESINILEEQL